MWTLLPQNTYFPLARGRYDISPGLRRLGTDFGQGKTDHHIFQFDDRFHDYRKVKLSGQREDPDKYHVQHGFTPALRSAVTGFLVDRLCREAPEWFSCTRTRNGCRLECRLSEEVLIFDPDFALGETQGTTREYRDGFDALALQLQEDLAVLRLDERGRDLVCALHLSFPNFWSAADKIGKSFVAIHEPVPGMDSVNRHAPQLVDAMIHKGPFVRFAWGITTDDQLDHHPENGSSPATGRSFDPDRPELWLRVERQVMTGLPGQQAALFTIRTYLYPVADLIRDPARRRALLSALRSLSPDTLTYKGLADSLPAILDWLESR